MFEAIIGEFEQIDASVADEELFIALMRIAQDEAAIGEQLVSLLSLDDTRRKAELNRIITQMIEKKAPVNFVRAIACFLNDEVATQALAMLNE